MLSPASRGAAVVRRVGILDVWGRQSIGLYVCHAPSDSASTAGLLIIVMVQCEVYFSSRFIYFHTEFVIVVSFLSLIHI